MTGFAQRLVGQDDPAATIRPAVASLYEPTPPAPAGLDVSSETAEYGTAPGPAPRTPGTTAAGTTTAPSGSAAGAPVATTVTGRRGQLHEVTGFAHRLAGREDPAATIRPAVASLYDPTPSAPAGLDVSSETAGSGTVPGPTPRTPGAPASPARWALLARQAHEGSGPEAATRPAHPYPGQGHPDQADRDQVRPAHPYPGQGHPDQADRDQVPPAWTHRDQAQSPLIPDSAAPGAAAVPRHRAGQRAQPAGVPLPRPPSWGLQGDPPRPEPASAAIQAAHPVRSESPGLPPSPAFPAVHPARPGSGPTPDAARPGWRASWRGDQPQAEPGPPDVHITIGRIEVRAVTEPTAVARQEPRRPGSPSLQDYLRGRDGRA